MWSKTARSPAEEPKAKLASKPTKVKCRLVPTAGRTSGLEGTARCLTPKTENQDSLQQNI